MGRITSSERTGQFQPVFDRLKARAQINHVRSTTPPTWVALAERQEDSYPRDRHRVIVSLAIGPSVFLVICHGSQNSKINSGVSTWRWPGISFIQTLYRSFCRLPSTNSSTGWSRRKSCGARCTSSRLIQSGASMVCLALGSPPVKLCFSNGQAARVRSVPIPYEP
jgi:hypothetical protein